MTIRRYTVKRITVDYYSITEEELIETRKGTRWEFIAGYGNPYPSDLPEQAQPKNPRRSIRKDGQSYYFYACVYSFPHPAFMGKGWVDAQGDEIPDKPYFYY